MDGKFLESAGILELQVLEDNDVKEFEGSGTIGDSVEEVEIDTVPVIGYLVVKHGMTRHIELGADTAVLFFNNGQKVGVFHVMPEDSTSNSDLELRTNLNGRFDGFL